MWTLLEQLRARPRAARQRIAIFVSGVLSIAVFMFWWGGLTANDHVEPVADIHTKSPVAVVGETIKSFAGRSRSLWQNTMTQMQYDAGSEIAGVGAAGNDATETPSSENRANIDPLPTQEAAPPEPKPDPYPDAVFPEGTDSTFDTGNDSTTTN